MMLELEGKELVKKQKGKGKEKVVYEEIETDEEITTLIDSRADVNCIQEGLILIQYYEKTLEGVTSTNGFKMNIQYKLSNARVCKGQICYNTSFVLVKNINTPMVLGTPFLTLLYPFQVTKNELVTKVLNKEICFEFIKSLRTRELNILKGSLISKINIIKRKKKHINMLNREIKFKRASGQVSFWYLTSFPTKVFYYQKKKYFQ
ncbi:hypothetical protein CR513_30260, partial [Mucuna pruriens]